MGIIRTARTSASTARSVHRHRHLLKAGEHRREGLALVAAEVGHEPLKAAAQTAAVAGGARMVAAGVAAGTIAAGGATAIAAPVAAGLAAAYVTGKAADRIHDRYANGGATVSEDLGRVRAQLGRVKPIGKSVYSAADSLARRLPGQPR